MSEKSEKSVNVPDEKKVVYAPVEKAPQTNEDIPVNVVQPQQ